jgi:hypothetical protein
MKTCWEDVVTTYKYLFLLDIEIRHRGISKIMCIKFL